MWGKKEQELPDSFEHDISMLTCFNQREIPACVAHATVSQMQWHWYQKIGRVINFSPRFLDIMSWTDGLGLHGGRDPNVVMDLSYKIGCCTEDLLPNDTTLSIEKYRDKSLITQQMIDEAFKFRMEILGLVPTTIF